MQQTVLKEGQTQVAPYNSVDARGLCSTEVNAGSKVNGSCAVKR